ncbi:hypothetical protein JQX13_43620 [Archangium violaceum]|uniref:hypothetical protein n=1 Tax=Archangium violaceum TaxID=83451 RepID=UPI00193C59AC|nr:hypothetical protein [Archangium violaceum]QRK06882.1 hypothetical protein JQX13_43620 [Archangium violaceum]
MGEVTLSLEQDTLEALRLGTHVGSCLGLNGLCDCSAAVVLDVNKRVLYARGSRNRRWRTCWSTHFWHDGAWELTPPASRCV